MARAPRDVTDAELAVLLELWGRGPSSRRQLAEALYPRGGTAAYTTVQKLLERLEAKGYVTLRPGATLTAEELIAFSRETLPGFKAPSEIEFGELPKTSTGKVKKFELRERARAGR